MEARTLPNSNISARKFLEYLTDKTIDLKGEYISKYHKNPKYIKMPEWCLHEINIAIQEQYTYSIPNFDESTEPKFMGMRVCETVSIKTIGEIEVF